MRALVESWKIVAQMNSGNDSVRSGNAHTTQFKSENSNNSEGWLSLSAQPDWSKWIGSALIKSVFRGVLSASFLALTSVFSPEALAISIPLDGSGGLISGTDCSVATYRYGSTAVFEGQPLDLLVEVLEEETETLSNFDCIEVNNGRIEISLRDRADDGNDSAYMNVRLTVVRAGTTTPVEVDRITMTALDLDINPGGGTGTDDIYLQSPDAAYLSSDSLVQYSEGSYFGGEFNVRLGGTNTGNCDDTVPDPDPTCRVSSAHVNGAGGANRISSIFLRVQNDNAFGTRNFNNTTANRLFTISLQNSDFEATVGNNEDYGSAPNSYGSAGHVVSSLISLGNGLVPDHESDLQASANGNGDDADDTGTADPNFDDEDGVQLGAQPLDGQSLTAGTTTNLDITTFGAGFLSAWIDLDGDGNFTDADEQVVDDLSISSGTVSMTSVPLTIPPTATAGNTFIRFRFSSAAGVDPDNFNSATGEVEDYGIAIAPQLTTLNNAPANACPLGQGIYANWTELVDNTSGRGTFNPAGPNAATLPNFSWTTTGTHNIVAVDSAETFDGTNSLEPIYGEADTADNLNVGLPGNTGSNGTVLDQITTLTITFDQSTPSSGWALALIDLDVDQALIRATDADGNAVPLATIDSWFVQTFDANPTTSGINLPTWDADDAALVGSGVADGQYTNLIDTSIADNEASGAWFQPNVSLSSITIQFENKFNGTATYHAYLASCLGAIDYGDAPDSYGTNISNDGGEGVGPSHGIITGLQLGTAPDAEVDAATPLDASGDGAEDDGVTLATLIEGDTTYTIPATDITVTNTTGTAATLHAWVDFDGSGTFEADEYASQTVQSGSSNPDGALTWSGAGVSGLTGSTTTYARFRLTTDADIDANAPILAADDGEVEDYGVAIAPIPSNPDLLVVKRLTAINRSQATEQLFDSTYVDVGSDTSDNYANWPTPLDGPSGISEFLAGATTSDVEPGDELEYTIYFISSGDKPITNVNICDMVPANTTYVSGSMERFISGATTSLTDSTSDADGAEFIATPTMPTVPCPQMTNDQGAIVINVAQTPATLPNATAPGDPVGAYGYIRFRVTVD